MTAAVLAAASLATGALAQSYPAKIVRVIVPTGPSGGVGTQGRLMSKKFTESMGQSFFLDDRPGASGVIGPDVVAMAPPDGYTLGSAIWYISPLIRALCRTCRTTPNVI